MRGFIFSFSYLAIWQSRLVVHLPLSWGHDGHNGTLDVDGDDDADEVQWGISSSDVYCTHW